MSNKITQEKEIFTGLDGLPLNAGYIYLGQPNQSPEVLANQIAVYWNEELTDLAAQPLRTLNGYIARNGSQANVYVAENNYSMSIRDKNNNLVDLDLDVNASSSTAILVWDATRIYNTGDLVIGSDGLYYRSIVDNNQGNDPTSTVGFWQRVQFSTVVADFSEARALDSNSFVDGDTFQISGFPDPWEVKTGTVTDNGWFIVFNDDSNRYAESTSLYVNVRIFEAVGDSVSDDTIAIQNAISYIESIGSGFVYIPRGDYLITSTLFIEASGTTLRGEGGDTGRSANANWPTRLFWGGSTSDIMIDLDADLSNDLRSVKFEELTIDCQQTASVIPVNINTNVSDGVFYNCVIRNINLPITQEQGSTGWKYDNTIFFNFDDCAVDLKNNNHRTSFYHCQAENITPVSADSVVRIGSSAGHCSNVNFFSCNFEANDVDYQVNARHVRALCWHGGYLEAPDANAIAFFKLGDTTDGTTCRGFSCRGMYAQGSSQIPYVFNIHEAEGVAIDGGHFIGLGTSVINNPNGCALSYYGVNYTDSQVFRAPNEASGFDEAGWVQIKLFNNEATAIPLRDGYGMVSFWVDEQTLEGGQFLLDANGGTAASAALSSNGSVTVTTGILTGTTGAVGDVTISCFTDGNMYLENRYGNQIQLTYRIARGLGADL